MTETVVRPTTLANDSPAVPDRLGEVARRDAEFAVPLISTVDRALDELDRFLDVTRGESLSALPDGPYPMEAMMASFEADIAMARRGVRMCCLYQSTAATSPEMIGYLTRMAAHGIRIRVRPKCPRRMLISDGRMALVAATEGSRGRPWMVLEEAALVALARVQFLRLWQTAQPVGNEDSEVSEQMVRSTVQVLVDGLTDQQAARKLGVTDRTIRRHMALVMKLLGARSRFECGVKAVRAGWL